MSKKAAKKTAKKSARPSAKKSASSTSSKVRGKAAKKSSGSAKSRKPAAKAPPRVTTGRGASATDIGRDLVSLVQLGKPDEAIRKWYSPKILSVEGDGQSWSGLKGIQAKNEWWYANHETHSMSAEGPYVGASGFSVRYKMSFTPKGAGRVDMTEVGVYTVKDGKIVREEYMYGG